MGKFAEYLEEFNAINKETEQEILEWLKQREQFINDNNIDSATMFSFLRRINYHNKRMSKLMNDVAKLIGYEL